MAFNIDNALGVSAKALMIRARRAEILAGNIANQDTPNYQAKDIDFNAAMKQISGQQGATSLNVTNSNHIGFGGSVSNLDVQYRTPEQPSLDGNTVDGQKEQAEYAQNSMEYMANFNFLNSKIKSILFAIKGD